MAMTSGQVATAVAVRHDAEPDEAEPDEGERPLPIGRGMKRFMPERLEITAQGRGVRSPVIPQLLS